METTLAFLIPDMPQPKKEPPPPAPRLSDSEVAQKAAEQRRKLYAESPGRRSTLGGGLDVMGFYPTAQARALGLTRIGGG
jgi:hypothetical protein